MAEIKRAHVFNVGTWNGIEITEPILESLVQSFQAMANDGRIPLKLGHNDEQKVTDGQPAIGWVTKLWKEGGALFADFAGMPATIYDSIKHGLYKFVSIEMLRDVEWNGSKWPAVLDAVALLGADRPAVTVLNDLQGLTAMSRQIPSMRVGARAAFSQAYTFTNHGDRKAMSDDIKSAIDAALAPVTGELKTLREKFAAQSADLKTAQDEAAAAKAKVEATEKAARDTRIATNKERFTAHVNATLALPGNSPAKRDAFIKASLKDDDAYASLDFGMVEIVFGKIPTAKGDGKTQSFSTGGHGNRGSGMSNEDVTAVLRKRVREYTEAHREVDVFTAHARVLRADPDLADEFKAHLNQTGHERGQPIAAFGN